METCLFDDDHCDIMETPDIRPLPDQLRSLKKMRTKDGASPWLDANIAALEATLKSELDAKAAADAAAKK